MFNATGCKCFQWVHKCPGGKTSKDVSSIMIEVCTECFENRKKGQIVQHVKMKKGGWRYQRSFLRGGYMWFKIRHFPLRLIIAWTMFMIQCLRHLGVSQNLCQVTPYHHLRKEKLFWDCIFFCTSVKFLRKIQIYFELLRTPLCGPHLSLSEAAVCFACSNSHGAPGGWVSASCRFSSRNNQVCLSKAPWSHNWPQSAREITGELHT